MWSGPVGLGAIRTRGARHRRAAWCRDAVEQRRVRLAGQDPDEGGRSETERRPAARAVERQRVERFAAGQDRDLRARRQRARLEVRQQAGVLLGLLGDPVDRRGRTGLHLAQADAGRPATGGLGVDRVAVRARLGVPEHLVEAGLDPRRDGALEAHRLVVRFGPAEADDRGQQPLEQRVPAEDAVGGGPAGGRQVEVATLGVGDQPVRHEPAEHLAGGLGRDAEVAGDLGGRHAARRRRGRRGRAGRGGIPGRRPTGRADRGVEASRSGYGTCSRCDTMRSSAARPRWPDRPARRAAGSAPSAARRESPSAAPPVADRMSDATTAAASRVKAAIVAIEAAAGIDEQDRQGRRPGGRRASDRRRRRRRSRRTGRSRSSRRPASRARGRSAASR